MGIDVDDWRGNMPHRSTSSQAVETHHKRWATGVLLVGLTILIVGCWDIDSASEPIVWEELIGTYEPTYETGGTEQIILRADSTYLHTFQLPEGELFSNAGRWRLVYEQGRKTRAHVRFHEFVNWYPLLYNCFNSGTTMSVDTLPVGWMPYVKKHRSGLIRLVRCPNDGQFYNKVKGAESGVITIYPCLEGLHKVPGAYYDDRELVIPEYNLRFSASGQRFLIDNILIGLELDDSSVCTYQIMNSQYLVVTIFPDSLRASSALYALPKDHVRLVRLANPSAVYEAHVGGWPLLSVDEGRQVVVVGVVDGPQKEVPLRRRH
jgi:hypothetical protein